MATPLSLDSKESEMAASEEAYGAGHPATYAEQPKPTTRRMELSGEFFGEDQVGLVVPVRRPFEDIRSAERDT